MAGQGDNRYGDKGRMPTITEGVSAPVSETDASATYTGATNAGFVLYSKLPGTAGNAITYTITTAANDNLAVSVVGTAITIALANTTSSKNTATLVKAAIEANSAANALVVIALTGTGAGVVATQTVTSLTGGGNGTAGNLDDVRFDTNGNRWEMIWTNGVVYYWSPEGFPSISTEYPAYVDAGAIVFKKKINSTTASAGGIVNTAHGVVSPVFMEMSTSKGINNIGREYTDFFYNSATDYFSSYRDQTNISTATPNAAVWNNRPVVHVIFYKRGY